MSVEQGGGNAVHPQGEPDVLLAQALAQAVRQVGRNLAADPRRVQGMVSDVLGAESRSRRAEIDAVVLAAEEGVPDELLSGRIDVDTALMRLRARGLDNAVAFFAVDVWRYALGMLAEGAQPPSLRTSVPVSSRPAVTDPASVSDSDFEVDADATLNTPPAHWPQPQPHSQQQPQQPQYPSLTTSSPRNAKRMVLLVAVPLLVIIAVVGLVVALGGDDEPTATASPTTDAPSTSSSSTTTTTTTTTTTVPTATFEPEATEFGAELSREWKVEGEQLSSTLELSNPTAAAVTGRYYEVVPKSLAATADLIQSATPFVVIKADPVIAFDVTVGPGETAEVTYSVGVADPAAVDLDALQKEQADQAAAFAVERATPPALTVNTANDALAFVPEIDITGTVEVGSAVNVNFAGVDSPATVNADGTWTFPVPGLNGGNNPFIVTATQAWKTAPNSVSLNVIYYFEAPPTEDTATPSGGTKPSVGGGGGGGGGGINPPTGGGGTDPAPTDTEPQTTDTQAPARAPVINLSGPSSVPACHNITLTASVQFADASTGTWTSPGGSGSGATFRTHGADNATSYSFTAKYTVTGPGGPATKSITVTVTPDPSAGGYIRTPAECAAVAGG